MQTNRKWMQDALELSQRSYCKRRQVGCIIVKDQVEISHGFNGTPPGADNVCEIDPETSAPNTIHAEINALMKLAAGSGGAYGSTVFVTESPCATCATALIMAGVSEVYYHYEYRDRTGLEILIKQGIKIINI